MKKKLLSVACSLGLILVIILVGGTDAKAFSISDTPVVEGSYLTNNSEDIGYVEQLTRGIDLLNGYSKIVRLGPGKIYAGGTTLAAHTVNRIQISVLIERVAKEGDAWEFVDGWHAEALNADRVAANRGLNVEGNYYYRIRCTHSAGNDMSSSFTNGVFVEEP